ASGSLVACRNRRASRGYCCRERVRPRGRRPGGCSARASSTCASLEFLLGAGHEPSSSPREPVPTAPPVRWTGFPPAAGRPARVAAAPAAREQERPTSRIRTGPRPEAAGVSVTAPEKAELSRRFPDPLVQGPLEAPADPPAPPRQCY